jgi:membrane associated rhomboid family serine protease
MLSTMTAFDAPDAQPPQLKPLPETAFKREAEDWALVLVAEGFQPRVERVPLGWRVGVELGRESEAAEIIAAWRQERLERIQQKAPAPAPRATSFEIAAAYTLALGLLAFHLGLEASDRHESFVDAGRSQAALVMAGEVWRAVTALTLHADLAHVVGNTLFGGFFLAALAARLGVGCGVLAFLVSGSLGNLANAVYYGHAHSSIGASTGVFGLVGVLAGLAAWQRHQTAPPGRGAWVAFAAGLAIVAMLGTGGPRVDFSAHLFGLAAGGLTGILIALPVARHPRPGLLGQLLALAVSAAIVLGCWSLADLGELAATN